MQRITVYPQETRALTGAQLALAEELHLQMTALAESPHRLLRILKSKGPAALATAMRTHGDGLAAMAARMRAIANEWDGNRAGARRGRLAA
jgi:hypothetical protein